MTRSTFTKGAFDMNVSKMWICGLVAVVLLVVSPSYAQAPLGTAFIYQGQLKDGGAPANDEYDFIFKLFDDPVVGTQVGGDVEIDEWLVSDGLFTVQLDFGEGVFTGDALWLEVSVRLDGDGEYSVLSPRQPLTGTPYALYALSSPGGAGFWAANGDDIYNTNSGQVGIGTTSPSYPLHVESDDADAVYGESTASGGVGVYGKASSFEGGGFGLRGDSYGPTGVGVFGIAAMSTGNNYGVYGQSQSQTGRGVYGFANSGTGVNYGVYGHTNSPDGWAGYFSGRGYFSGNVGIGTTDPTSMLEVESTADVHGIRSTVPYIAIMGHRASTTGTWPAIHGECDSEASNGSAIRGIMTSTTPGSGSAAVKGVNNGTAGAGVGVYGSQDGSGYGVHGSCPNGRGVYGYSANAYGGYFTGSENDGTIAALAVQSGTRVMLLDGNEIDSNGALYLNNNSTNDVYIANGGGNVIVPVLQITGADLAEKFPVSEEVKPGMVVAIDRDHPGQLCLARGAYNRCVAGVVSGANGLSPGAVLGNMPGQEDSPAIALGGRVWVHCDASGRPIEPGDLLTTSDTPGHAMKVTDHGRAQGAIIGKAMTSLDSGRGLVLVLVGLQ